MTESIFDPTGPQTEHSGTRYMGPSADNDSHMPPSIVDGQVAEDETVRALDQGEETQEIAAAESDAQARHKEDTEDGVQPNA